MKLLFFQTVKSKVIISLSETVRLSVSISLRNLYNPLNSIKESSFPFGFEGRIWDLIVLVPDQSQSFCFGTVLDEKKNIL